MARRRKSDEDLMRERFPSARARDAADDAVDTLDAHAPMSAYVDTWIAAYRAAGGREKVYSDE